MYPPNFPVKGFLDNLTHVQDREELREDDGLQRPVAAADPSRHTPAAVGWTKTKHTNTAIRKVINKSPFAGSAK